MVSVALGVEDRHRAFRQIAAVGGLPFVVDVGEDGADESDDGSFVGEDSHDTGATFDLLVEPIERVGRSDLRRVRTRVGAEGEDCGAGVVHLHGDLREAISELVADLDAGGTNGVGGGPARRTRSHCQIGHELRVILRTNDTDLTPVEGQK